MRPHGALEHGAFEATANKTGTNPYAGSVSHPAFCACAV